MNLLRLSHEREVSGMLGILGAVLAPSSSIYVSSPITTGPRLIRWHEAKSRSDAQNSFEQEVLRPNLAKAKEAVAIIRETAQVPVIDPTALPEQEEWTQDDYRFLWGRVIELFALEVVFLEGWEFSSGCTYEYLVATNVGLPTRSYDRTPIALPDALTRIRRAHAQLRSVGADATFVGVVLGQLELLREQLIKEGASRVQR
jgi:hypothetical protein